MANLPLTLAFAPNARVRPLLEGTVRPEGITLTVTQLDPAEIFWRQLHFAEFDVSEMSLSSLLIVTARGDSPWVGLPIFTTRQFFHTGILVRADAGIAQPADLRGKRVGVPEYQQTAAVWCRGALQHEFGVAPTELEWYMERTVQDSHGGATGFQPPPGVALRYIPPDQNIASLMVAGELDATVFFVARGTRHNRSVIDLRRHPRVRPLFPDPVAEGRRYYQKTGLFPMNHTVVVRRAIVERHPWVALNLYRAFQAAKERAAAETRALVEPYLRLGLLPAEAQAAFATDPFPYGLRANRHALETLTQYSYEQGLTPRRVALEEVFAPSTLDL